MDLAQRIARIDASPLLTALSQICDLGSCGGKGGFQKAIDIASAAVEAELTRFDDSELVSFAERELELIGSVYDGMVNEAVLDIVRIFSAQGHSGGSAQITTELVGRLMRYQPLSQLTGADDEWMEIQDDERGPLWQNRRCPHVFKHGDRAWDIDLPRVDGGPFAEISFPYTPD